MADLEVGRSSATQHGRTTRSNSQGRRSGGRWYHGTRCGTWIRGSRQRGGGTRRRRTCTCRQWARGSGSSRRAPGMIPPSTPPAKSAGAFPSPTRTSSRISRWASSPYVRNHPTLIVGYCVLTMLKGIHPANPGSASARTSRRMAGIRRVRGAGTRNANSVGTARRARRRLVARAIGGVRVRGRIRDGGWVGAGAGFSITA